MRSSSRTISTLGAVLAVSLSLGALGACGDASGTGGGGSSSSSSSGGVELPPALGPLPPVATTKTDRFTTSGECAQCHLAAEATVMHDQAGADISPVFLWRSSMMAFAARDPYYLAVVSHELDANESGKDAIETACTRCHAPAAALEHEQKGGHTTLTEITEGTSPEANLARDGVTCSMCHQIADKGLGTNASFGGGFDVGFDRTMFGPHQNPLTDPMQFFVSYTPTYATHMTKSELCATCHTVVTPVTGANGKVVGQFLEQAPYLEWSQSSYSPGQPCGSCHVPPRDVDDTPIISPISKYPASLMARQPFGEHGFVGANQYVLSLLADNAEWTGSGVSSDELSDAAKRSQDHLRGAATVTIASAAPDGADLAVVVAITNKAGHKLPTGYPSRRMWIHLRVDDGAGQPLFESGAWDPAGLFLVDGAGKRIDGASVVLPHLDTITTTSEAQVYEAVPVDAGGKRTHRPLSFASLAKDDRILPTGWAAPSTSSIAPRGVSNDATFVAGGDQVTYRVPGGASARHVRVELVYQSLAPDTLEDLATVPTPAAVKLTQMAKARPPEPFVMASDAADLP